MSQVIPVVSEALQSTVRKLLPSQFGFGEDLQASNVIIPIIDLTASAEGSAVGVSLQQALSFGSQTSVTASNTTTVLANTAGFWKIDYNLHGASSGSAAGFAAIQLSDSLSTKNIVECTSKVTNNVDQSTANGTLIVYLDAGDSISCVSTSVRSVAFATARQVATTAGVLVNPAGFTPE